MTVPYFDSGASTFANTILGMLGEKTHLYYNEAYRSAGDIVAAADFDYDNYPAQMMEGINFCRVQDALRLLEQLQIQDVVWPGDVPTDVAQAPQFDPIEFFDPTSIPNFSGSMADLEMPPTPDPDQPALPGAAPTVTYPTTPTREQRTWPILPDLAMPILPSPIIVTIPTFDESLTVEDLLDVTDTFTFQDEYYTSDLATLIKNIFATAVEGRSFGLISSDESGLMDRSAARARGPISWAETSHMNFTYDYPQDIGESLTAISHNLASRAGFLRGAELARSTSKLDDRKTAISQSLDYEDVEMQLANAVAVRALGASKAEALFLISIYNARVARHNAIIKRFAALADVFSEQIRAETAKVQLFRGMIDAEREKVNFNKTTIKLYEAQVEAVQEAVKAYTVDVEAAKVVAEGEKLKLDVFKAEVEAIVAQVRAKEYEAEGYKAKVKGEKAKVEAYAAQADAFAAVGQGVQTAVEANKLRLKQFLDMNKDLLAMYQTEGQVLEETASVYSDINRSKTLKFKSLVDVYAARLNGVNKVLALDVAAADKEYASAMGAVNANADLINTQMREIAALADLRVDASAAYSGALKTLAAAAMSALNVTASLSSSISSSYNFSSGLSRSESTSVSFSDSTNFNESHSTNEATTFSTEQSYDERASWDDSQNIHFGVRGSNSWRQIFNYAAKS